MSETAADTFQRTCAATHSVKVCKPWVLLCRTSKTNGLTEAIVLGKVISKLYWAEDTDSGEVDESGQRWAFITESEWERDCFLSRSQVYRALEKLEALGFVAQQRVQRRQRNGELGGNPLRHVTVFADAIGEALEAFERGEWDPEPLLRVLASSRGRDESHREDAPSSGETSARQRDEIPESDREDAISSARVRDEVSRNKEEIPPSNTSARPNTSPGSVASDAAPAASRGRRSKAKSEEPSHPNYHAAFDVVTAAFGLPREGNSDATRGKVQRVRKAALAVGLLDDLDRLADLIWLYRGQTTGVPDVGTFPSAVDRLIAEQERLVVHRDEAAALVAAACADLGLGCAGRADSQPRAEVAVAALLDGNADPTAIAGALRSSDGWTAGALRTALGQARPRHLTVVGSDAAPPDLDGILTLDLVAWLQRPISAEDVGRVGAEVVERIEALTPRQREILLDVIRKGTYEHPTNGASVYVQALIEKLNPKDPERAAAVAANLAAWGAPVAQPEPLALPGGTTR